MYLNTDPWPAGIASGSTLALTNPLLDNSGHHNWIALTTHGSPGAANSQNIVGLADRHQQLNVKIYPNPSRGFTNIKYFIEASGEVSISVFNYQGQLVEELVNSTMPAGNHDLTWKSDYALKPGLYFVRTVINQESTVLKLIIKH